MGRKMESMKIVEFAARDYAIENSLIGGEKQPYMSFIAGAEFAQQWINVKDELPENKNDVNNSDIDCLCIVHGLSMNASEYTEFKVLKFRPKLNCFIEWVYNSKGEFVSIKYNDAENNYPNEPKVTHWRPIERK